MTSESIIDIGVQSLIVAMKVASPALFAVMVMGLVVSIFQAATQINEQTLSFIPKVLAMTAAIIWTGPWILQTMMFFTTSLFKSLPGVTD